VDEACLFEVAQRECQRARRDARQRSTQLGEAAAAAQFGEYRHRPLAQQCLSSRRPARATRHLRRAAARRGDHVLGPQRVAVARVAAHVAELDQRVERTTKRLAADVQLALQLDESRSIPLVEQRERGRCPAVMEQRDQRLG
jgi:hypothetical protein